MDIDHNTSVISIFKLFLLIQDQQNLCSLSPLEIPFSFTISIAKDESDMTKLF